MEQQSGTSLGGLLGAAGKRGIADVQRTWLVIGGIGALLLWVAAKKKR